MSADNPGFHPTSLRQSVSRRAFLGASVLLTCLPGKLFAEEQPETVLRFAAMSDVHFSENPQSPEVERLRKALNFMYEYSAKQKYAKFDAILVAGDMTNHGKPEELKLFRKELDAGLRPETKKVLCMGNHEFHIGTQKSWEAIVGAKPNDVYNVNGFRFIALSPDRGNGRNGDYASSMPWLKNALDDAVANDPDKPIFLFQHYHISETVYGSCGDDRWGINDLRDFLRSYPQVINFSGHSHYPINDPKSAWQDGYSAFGTGTLSYFEMAGGVYQKFPEGFRNAAQLYVVEVRKDNSVLLKPYDILTNDFFDLYYLIAEPAKVESYLYTKKRIEKAKAPIWHPNTNPKVREVDSYEATFEFRHAQRSAPDDIVHSYRAAIDRKKDGKWIDAPDEWIWSEYYFNNMPENMTARLNSLEPETEYRVRFSPLDAFEKEGDQLPPVEFKTTKDPLDTVDKNAPFPMANVLNVSFDKAKAVNRPENALPKQKDVESYGKPELTVDPNLKMTVARFNGVNDYFRIRFSRKDYKRLQNTITMAAKFKIDAFDGKSSQNVFANTEGGGYAFEINHKNQTVQFWCSVNGAYTIIEHRFEPGQYVTAFGIFDGQNVILYLNGKEVARKAVKGKITYPQNERAHAFCIGSDIAHDGTGSNFFKGTIAWAKLYSWALSAGQIANLSK